ncbi:MAG: YraN family protein [Terriglobia bacterium]
MSLFARFVYATLVWQDRRRARMTNRRRGPPAAAPAPQPAPHLVKGRRGETLAYWYLRRTGYTMVARNLRMRADAGELDLIGWDGQVLAFVEVKTRTSLEGGQPEEAVGERQRRRIVKAAEAYMRRLRRKELDYRFDIVSVIWDEREGFRLRLIKDAFKGRAGRAGPEYR